MTKYDFRQFQNDLAAIDRKAEQMKASDAAQDGPLGKAKREFLDLRNRYNLTVADVVSFFPEEEGIQYLLSLLAASEGGPKQGRRRG